jgi:hypothetical protein
MIMRLIVEDTDGMSGEFYASTQEQADRFDNGRVAVEAPGWGSDGHVTILAIELEDGRFGWLRGTAAGEGAKALRLAAMVLGAEDHSSQAQEVAAYLNGTAEHLDRQAGQTCYRSGIGALVHGPGCRCENPS